MQQTQSIFSYKQKLLIFLSALFIALILQPRQTVYADWASDFAASMVHSDGSSGSGANDVIENGVTYTRTGYLAYLLTADGAPVPGTQAVAFSSPGFAALSGAEFKCTSRKGGYTATEFNGGEAPWRCTPWTPSGSGSTVSCATNEPQIKQWFESMDGNNENGSKFVYKHWGYEATQKFQNNEYIIVIETIMHFQYSKPTGNISDGELFSTASKLLDRYSDNELYDQAVIFGYPSKSDWIYMDANAQTAVIQSIKNKLLWAIVERLRETVDTSTRVFVGPPVIGTVPNLLTFRAQIGLEGNPFSSYTNKIAPFSEYAIADGVAERAGFIPWTGSTSSKISDSDVQNYAVAMMIITATKTGQTTCDESLIPSPHNPPIESQGKVTIVKSYRTKTPTGLQNDGTFNTPNLSTQIIIENEQQYQVVGWKTSTTTNTGISSLSWNPPSPIQQGTSPKQVTLQPQETCLYVLLEKVEEEPPEEEPWNYNLTQSQITRRVWLSDPDNPLTNMSGDYKIDTKPFRWIANAHDGCDTHNHKYQGPCSGHKQDCDCNNLQQSLF